LAEPNIKSVFEKVAACLEVKISDLKIRVRGKNPAVKGLYIHHSLTSIIAKSISARFVYAMKNRINHHYTIKPILLELESKSSICQLQKHIINTKIVENTKKLDEKKDELSKLNKNIQYAEMVREHESVVKMFEAAPYKPDKLRDFIDDLGKRIAECGIDRDAEANTK